MSETLRRSKRSLKHIDYNEANKRGLSSQPLDMGRVKRKRNAPVKTNKKKGGPKKRKSEKILDTQPENENENLEPSPSDVGLEIVDDLHSDMGGNSGDSHDPETSDIDSDELERQNQELEDLDRQIAERRARCSNKERRERKQKMKEMRKLAEEKRQILHALDSEDSDEQTEKKRQKFSKSKDGKGVKGIKKSKGRSEKQPLKNDTRKPHENPIKKKKGRDKMITSCTGSDTSPDSSFADSSSSNEMSRQIKRVRHRSSKRHKTSRKQTKEIKELSSGKKKKTSSRKSSSDSSDSSPDSSDSSDETSYDGGSSSTPLQKGKRSRKRQKKGKSLKSGVKAKAHKIRLKTSELCAQAVLDEEHFPGSILLEDLSFNQLVAGELEICTMCDVSRRERTARLKILKLLAYYASLLSQGSLIEIYKAVILKIEKGLFAWSTEIVEKTENMLDRAVSKSKFQVEQEAKKTDKQGEKVKRKAEKNPALHIC